MSQHALGELVV